MYALSAMDIALWDARAQTYSVPIHHLLGTHAATAVEYFTWYPEDFFESQPTIEQGMVALSTAPGIGARPSDESLARYAV